MIIPNPELADVLYWAPGLCVEVAAERAMDRLDRRYLAGRMTVEQYDAACKALDAWTRSQS